MFICIRTYDGATKSDITAEMDVTRDSKMVQVNDLGDFLEPVLEVANLPNTY